MFKKMIAAILATSLLGQSTLFAQQISPTELEGLESSAKISAEDLQEYQQQALQDLQELGLTPEQKKIFFTAGGTIFASSIIFAAVHIHQMKVQQKEYQTMFENLKAEHNAKIEKANSRVAALEKEANKITNLERENASLQAKSSQNIYAETLRIEKIKALEKELSTVKTEMASLQKQLAESEKALSASSKNKVSLIETIKKQKSNLANLSARNKELLIQLEKQSSSLELYKSIYAQYTNNYRSVEKMMKKYLPIFESTVDDVTRTNLLRQLYSEPSFMSLDAKTKDFLQRKINSALLKNVSHRGQSLILSTTAERLISENLPSAINEVARSIGYLSSKLATKTNIIVGLLIGFGIVASQQTQAQENKQKVANRINKNFNLFLNASPESLETIAFNEEAAKVCVQGSIAINMLKDLSKEEIDAIESLLYEAGLKDREQTYDALRKAATY